MRFISLASSSKGNSELISYKNTNVLVDCGISKKKIVEGLSKYNLTLNDINYILITHEHSDHISALPSILKDNDIKVISQRDTLSYIINYCEERNVKVNTDNFKIISPVNILNDNVSFELGDIEFYPLKGHHDVASLYYKFKLGDTIIAILTDIGAYNEYTVRTLEDVNYLMLESNYDEQMILENSYPMWLKTRIMGEDGHLSNRDSANLIMRLAGKCVKEVYLSHISKDSNSEENALNSVNKFIEDNFKSDLTLPAIKVASRLEITEIINDEE